MPEPIQIRKRSLPDALTYLLSSADAKRLPVEGQVLVVTTLLTSRLDAMPEQAALHGDPKDSRIRNYGRGYSDAIRDVKKELGL